MYREGEVMAAKNATGACIEDRSARTVEENIDIKIGALRKEIERLEESKKTLGPLLHMVIRDVREAMSY